MYLEWFNIPERYKWFAFDADEKGYVFEHEPRISVYLNRWVVGSGRVMRIDNYNQIKLHYGNTYWQESLLERPK